MEKETIKAFVYEEYDITEDEKQMILLYRRADQKIKDAVHRVLDVDEEE